MASFSDLKIDKFFQQSLNDYGIKNPNTLQSKVLKRYLSGNDFTVCGLETVGKSTTLLMGIIGQLKYAKGDIPRAMVLCPSREDCEELNETFGRLAKHTDLRSLELVPGRSPQGQKDMLFDGVDVVFGTPDRVLSIYLKSGLNINDLQIFALDNADLIVKQGFQSAIWRLSESLPKCQRVVFTNVYHDKIERLISAFQFNIDLIEVELELIQKVETLNQQYYQVPNFQSKLNLLNLLMRDPKELTRLIIFVNTRLTASKIYKELNQWHEDRLALLNPMFFEQLGFKSIEDFENSEVRTLIIANEGLDDFYIPNIPYFVHFDIPEDIDLMVDRLKYREGNNNQLAITICSDIELSLLRKVELATGTPMEYKETLEKILEETLAKTKSKKIKKTEPEAETESNPAFHDKKAKNTKDYNYNLRQKRELSGKKQSRRRNKN